MSHKNRNRRTEDEVEELDVVFVGLEALLKRRFKLGKHVAEVELTVKDKKARLN